MSNKRQQAAARFNRKLEIENEQRMAALRERLAAEARFQANRKVIRVKVR